MKLGNILVKWVLPLVKSVGKTELVKLLNNWHKANPAHYKTVVTGAYPLIDVQLEDYVKTTQTTIDDDIVKDLKAAIEESAAACGVELPNLDAGTVND